MEESKIIIKTSRGIEIELNMETIYRQVWLNKEKLKKNDLIIISQELGLPKLNKNNTKIDLVDELLNNIYQSNYLDSLNYIHGGRKVEPFNQILEESKQT